MSQMSIGQRLRQAREAIPASLTEASRATRVRVDFLEAMERDSFAFISGRVYVVGMLRSYARWLRLNDEEIAAEFGRIYGEPEHPGLTESLAPRKGTRLPSGLPHPQPWTIAGAAAGGILVVLLVFSLLHGGGKTTPPLVGSPSPIGGPSVVPSVLTSVLPSVLPSNLVPSPAPSVTVSPTPSGTGVQVLVVSSRSSRVQVLAGNTVPALVEFDGIMAPGSSQTFSAVDVLRLYFANLGAVNLIVNGKNLGAPGASGRSGGFDLKADGTLTPDASLPALGVVVPRTVQTSPAPVVHASPTPSASPSASPAASPAPSPAASPTGPARSPAGSPSP